MPCIGEVEDVVALLDHADHVGPPFHRIDERSHVAPTQQVGDALEVVEVELLIGQEDDEVLRQDTAEPVQLRRLGDRGQIDPGNGGAEGARHAIRPRVAGPARPPFLQPQARPSSSAPLRQKKRSRVGSSNEDTASEKASNGRFPPSGCG